MRPAQEKTTYQGHDLEAQKTFDRWVGKLKSDAAIAGGESVLLSVENPYPNADVWFRAPIDNLASFVGAVFTLYVIVGGVRTKKYQTPVTAAPTAGQGFQAFSMRGVGGLDSIEITLSIDPAFAAAIPATDVETVVTSWNAGGDESNDSPSPPGPVPVPGMHSFTGAIVYGQTGLIKASAGRLYFIDGTIDPAAPAGALWVQVFDKAAVPIAGDVPVWSTRVGAGGAFAWARNGRAFLVGMSWGVSTTRDTFTAGAAGDVAGVAAEFT